MLQTNCTRVNVINTFVSHVSTQYLFMIQRKNLKNNGNCNKKMHFNTIYELRVLVLKNYADTLLVDYADTTMNTRTPTGNFEDLSLTYKEHTDKKSTH